VSADDRMPGFEADIKQLFRESDRVEMEFMFDLWDYEEVRGDAENILSRIADKTMPCDAPWPEERIALFRDWIASGCPP
jgi:hypothetical protein